ncbi:MAG: DUF1772 domain-containing protein [Vicinamibacteraceae bacterium]
MIALVLATLCTGVFAGAAIYITLVEHPARLAAGTAAAIAEFRPSYRRAAPLQASLAAIGSLAAIVAWWQGYGSALLVAGLLQGSVIPFTLLVIYPTNGRLLDPALDGSSPEAAVLLRRWGQLHLVRSVVSGAAFILLVS